MRISRMKVSSIILLMLASAAAADESHFVDDFSDSRNAQWTPVIGDPWRIKDGEFFGGDTEGNYSKAMTVSNIELTEGVIEATVRPFGGRSSSIGIVGKYIDQERCWYIRYAYWGIMLMVPGREPFYIAPYLMLENAHPKSTHRPVRLKLVIRDARVGFFADGVLRAVFLDPLAGRAGRPGLYTESASYASHFSARKDR